MARFAEVRSERIDGVLAETYNSINDTYSVSIRDTQPLSERARFIRLIVTDED